MSDFRLTDEQWERIRGHFPEEDMQQIIERANLIQELRNALLAVAEERSRPGFISEQSAILR
jgi:hypothetical protein